MRQNRSAADFMPNREQCVLMVIDMQERLLAAMPTNILPGVLRNACILIETARELGLTTLLSEQYPKGLGPTAAEIKTALGPGVQPVEKLAFSCCRAPGFEPILKPLSRYDFILCGMETHVCVFQTALDLLESGQRVFIAADAVCSRTKPNWKIGLETMREAGAVIGSTEMFAFSLLGAAGTETFKRISKLVK